MFIKHIAFVVLGVLFVAGVSSALAGTFGEPQSLPPWNADAPINGSNAAQFKIGALTVATGIPSSGTGFVVDGGKSGFATGSNLLNATVDINGSIYTLGGSGDINGSGGTPTASDAQAILAYLDGGAIPSKANQAIADVDGNGVLDLADALITLNMAVGLSKAQAEQIVYGDEANLGRYIGDVNGDGVVNATDGLATRQLAAGTAGGGKSKYHRADANGDGRVTDADATIIEQWAVGLTGGGCSQAHRGKIIVIGSSGTSADQLLVCLKGSGTAYAWKEIQ